MATEQRTVEYRELPALPGYRIGGDGSVWTRRLKGGNSRTPDRFSAEWKEVKQHFNRRGYRFVNVTADGRERTRLVHQLVLEAFVGPRPDGQEGCHYPDPDKSNNRLENLRWDTSAENHKDKYRDRGPVVEKQCRRCMAVKSVADFYRDKRASDGLKTECKKCHCLVSVATCDPDKKRIRNREFMRKSRAAPV